MPIPSTRAELNDQVRTSFDKLRTEVNAAGPRVGNLQCVDDWSIKDLLSVRAWWTKKVVDWVEAGKRGEIPVTPAKSYQWKETPRLNADIVRRSRRESYRSVRDRLDQAFARVLPAIEALSDKELLETGVFAWTGKFPVSRWISINTARQYTTARTFIRRALR